MVGIDTNVLLRYIMQDDEAQSAAATDFLENSLSSDNQGFVSSIVLLETFWTLERGYKVPKELIFQVLEKLLVSAELLFEHREEAWKALRLYKTDNVGFADALLGLVHQKHGCTYTVTFDRKAATMSNFQELIAMC